MFERFTVEAVRAVELARDEARLLGERLVEPEHLLLGVVRLGTGAAPEALAILGVTPAAVRDVLGWADEGDGAPASGGPPLSRRAKRVLRQSLLELLVLGDREVGPEHLLLALTRDGDPAVGQLFAALHIVPEQVRAQLMPLLAPPRQRTVPSYGAAPFESAPQAAETPLRRRGWWGRRYLRLCAAADLLAALSAAALVVLLQDGVGIRPHDAAWLVGLPASWLVATALAGGYQPSTIGVGPHESRRVLSAALGLLLALAVVRFLWDVELSRSYVVLALLVVTSMSLAARGVLRIWLHGQWARGRRMRRLLVVGPEVAVLDLVRRLQAERYHGLQVVAACLPVPGQRPALFGLGVPVVGGFGSVAAAVRLVGAHSVAVLASPDLGPAQVAGLARDAEREGADLLVAAPLAGVAVRGRAALALPGLPLVRVAPSRALRRRLLVRPGVVALRTVQPTCGSSRRADVRTFLRSVRRARRRRAA